MDSMQASVEGRGAGGAGESPRPMACWCYQCGKEVMAGAEDDSRDATACPDCGSGFIETMDTARFLPDVRSVQRRRHRSRASERGGHGSPGEADENDESYQRQVLRLLRLLARSSRNIPYRSSEERQSNRGQRETGQQQEQALQGEASHHAVEQSLEAAEGGQRRQDAHEAYSLASEEEGDPGQGDAGDPVSSEHEAVGQDVARSQEENVDVEEEESESEAEARLLEVGDWGSIDEEEDEEWEEGEGEEENDAVEESQRRLDENEPEGREEPTENETEQVEGLGEDTIVGGNITRDRHGPRNLHNTIYRHLQEILRNLESHNIDVQLEIPLADTYVGNPGDYLDARGYEQLLQQLLDSDNSRRGAPPAAKSAVEGLISIIIEQKHHDDGSSLCAICKDTILNEEHAKQMPCLHLYHNDCILSWLSSRNSCPVCRYELPTDDADYEEQKRAYSFQQGLHATSSSQADINSNNNATNHANQDSGN